MEYQPVNAFQDRDRWKCESRSWKNIYGFQCGKGRKLNRVVMTRVQWGCLSLTWGFLLPGPMEGIVWVPSCVHLSYGEREALLCRGFGFVAAGRQSGAEEH